VTTKKVVNIVLEKVHICSIRAPNVKSWLRAYNLQHVRNDVLLHGRMPKVASFIHR